MRDECRVVITGIGLTTPLGQDRETSWHALQQGVSATRRLDEFPLHNDLTGLSRSGTPGLLAGAPAVLSTECSEGEDIDPVVRLGLVAAREALSDSGLQITSENRERIGCVIGTSKGGLASFARMFQEDRRQMAAGSGTLWTQFLPNAAAAAVAERFDLRGPVLCPVAACATGLASVARGADLIRHGACDIVVAGSADASLQAAILASFRRMGVLARDFDDPAHACRPFDRTRNGFLVGEGAAVVVLERQDAALARGAVPYGEWMAACLASDPSGLANLDDQGTSVARVLCDVLRRSNRSAHEIDYVNLHGTATAVNDVCETRALKAAFGPAAQRVRCSSLKGALGHLLGAAGSVELAFTLLAMRDAVIPPTVNLRTPDPECDLDYTPGTARRQSIEHALKLSLGFGGHVIGAVLQRGPRGG